MTPLSPVAPGAVEFDTTMIEPLIQATHELLERPRALISLVEETISCHYGTDYMLGVLADSTLRECRRIYEIALPLMFDDITAYRDTLQRTVIEAINTQTRYLIEAIIARASLLSTDDHRVYILGAALTTAVHVRDLPLVAMIIEGDFPLHTLSHPLYSACRDADMDLINTLLQKVLGPLVVDRKALLHEYGADHDVDLTLTIHRRYVLSQGLELAIARHSHEVCAVLLGPYVNILDVNQYTENLYCYSFLRHVSPQVFARFPREKCFSFLSRRLPTVLRYGILTHLRTTAPPDMLLTAEGHTYRAHRDILAHYSSYFRGPFRAEWVDSKRVDFGDNMSVKTLKAILYYLRIGEYDHVTMKQHNITVEEIWIAADYLGIECLAGRLRVILDRLRLRDEQACSSGDDEEEEDGEEGEEDE
ncbi:hypothetical protein BJY00DRAFT_49130 [Aspergillus carlsbadensis]|nr:hypothetical protein BJY00DRAFT_49130 [Aspergillus carlsbadensis]